VREKLIKYLGEGVKYEILHEKMDDEDGWAEVNLVFENFHTARETILGLGRAVEVVEPQALRYSVIDYARQIIELYGEKEDGQVKTLVREV
jgi:predicted DNA-binding transcriptional regulator YafY